MATIFPRKYTKIIDQLLSQMGYSLTDSEYLAKCILKLSDEYNSQTYTQDIWQNPNNQAAYLSYFFPLNYLRVRRAISHLEGVGYWSQSLNHWIELGSGSGAAFFAYMDQVKNPSLETTLFIESSNKANHLMKEILEQLNYESLPKMNWQAKWSDSNSIKTNSLFMASYSLNETDGLPAWASKTEQCLIVEPALQEQTRNLMALRQQLIEKNYYAWAPCIHQQSCPLLENSKKDWCFDRFFIDMPEWYYDIEKHLPMKNRSLTYSYLGMSKNQPELIKDKARVIGDTLKEKGKVRQAICRNTEREFLAWLKKDGTPPNIPRGSLYSTKELVKTSNELRPAKN